MFIVLFGKIASGKSTAVAYFKSKGFYTIDLDALARELVSPQSPTLQVLADTFGADLIDAKGTLNRSLLAERSFDSAEHTETLNHIMHQRIRELFLERLTELKRMHPDERLKLLVEVPLPDKAGWILDMADICLYISCPKDLRLKHACERGMSEKDFLQRDSRQASEHTYMSLASDIIENYGNKEEYIKNLETWAKKKFESKL